MQNKKIKPWFLFINGLIFILLLGYGFYYYKNKEIFPKQLLINDSQDWQKYNSTVKQAKNLEHHIPPISDQDLLLATSSAKLEMIIYDSPLEPFAYRYWQTLQIVQSKYADNIKIAFRLLSSNKLYINELNRLIVCAGEQKQFFAIYENIIKTNQDKKINTDYLKKISNSSLLNKERLVICLNSTATQDVLNVWQKQAEDNTIIGTPVTFINNNKYPGAYPVDDFIDSAGFKRQGLSSIIADFEK